MPRSPRSKAPGRRGDAAGGRMHRGAETGRVKVHDPFELVRWLALSQSDPRKALAELVQNSLDAGSSRIGITRVRERGEPCLKILDNGEGVIPELERPEALRYIASHIGHSRKRALSPRDRMRLMTQGQFGIGLLGFWSLGQSLEMRTSVPGQRPHRLVLYRDRSEYLIEPIRNRDLFAERWTEVVVVGLHREALPVLVGRRAAEYLASELRGQLLARRVEVLIEDRMARGRAEKLITVEPPRFLGERIEGLERIGVADQPPIQLEIYLVGEEDAGRGIAVYAAGTLVAEGFGDLAVIGLDRPPWTDPRLTGLVDFPGLNVAPGSRRGVLADAAATAFARALTAVEPVLVAALEEIERRRAEELDRSLVRDLQRAFRGFYRYQPRYALLPVDAQRGAATGPPGAGEGAPAAGEPGVPGDVPDAPGGAGADGSEQVAPLFPPGPLARVELVPAVLKLPVDTARRVAARAEDAGGRTLVEPVRFRWQVTGGVATLGDGHEEGGARVIVKAGGSQGAGLLSVIAASGERWARAEAAVEVTEATGDGRSDEGIPEPELVEHPGASWRSRVMEGRWQVNTAHAEYRAIRGSPALKLRYLTLLFAKEVVLRSTQDPRLDRPLEQLVEIAAFADRNLMQRRQGRGNRAAAKARAVLPGDEESQ